MVSRTPPDAADRRVCTFCGLGYRGRRNQCARCGTLLNEAAGDAKRLGAEARRQLHGQRALADLLFLIGLLLGGPMMTLGGELRLGLFITLAGGIASVLRRYTIWSTTGCALVGVVAAAIVATSVAEPDGRPEATRVNAEARGAYVEALTDPGRDLFVEGRGVDVVAVWFTVPAGLSQECGDYPPPEVREHLADLGFARIVVRLQNQSGGLCSFAP